MKLLRSLNDYFLSSVKREMMLMVTGTFVLVVGAILIVTYNVSIDLQMKDAKASDASKVRFISDNIDETVQSINRLMDSLTQDAEVQAALDRTNPAAYGSIQKLEDLILSKAMYSSDMFNVIYLFDTRRQLFHLRFGGQTQSGRLLNFNKYRYDTLGRTTWRIDHSIVYVEKSIRQRESLRTLGYISVEINKDYLRKRLQSEGSRFTFVYDENGNVLVGSRENGGMDTSNLFVEASLAKDGVPSVVQIPPYQDMLLTTRLSDYGKWRVVSVVPVSDIARGSEMIGLWIAIIGVLGSISGITIFWYTFSRLIAPLHDLKMIMDMADRDNFQYQANIRRRDEFGSLGRSFNRMMGKINYLISEVYQKEIAQRESEYKALKAQINPHFLYNTLDTIRWLAMYGETERIEKVAVSLSQILKASLADSKDLIPVFKEKESIDAYLAIQHNRFGNRISVAICLDDQIMDLYIPRFVLQPIVENAFIHGLEPKIGPGKLLIQGALSANGVVFRIVDDGVGMDEERARQLLDSHKVSISSATGNGSGVGNVHERITLLFGAPYGLSITSSPDAGTIVEITLPAIRDPSVVRST